MLPIAGRGGIAANPRSEHNARRAAMPAKDMGSHGFQEGGRDG